MSLTGWKNAVARKAPIPWEDIAPNLARAEDILGRLDERLSQSPIRDGFIARTHFADACGSLWLEGELVPLEDLVLHDLLMDIRTPTFELVRAHTVLRARRKIAGEAPDWALSAGGLDVLLRSSAPELDLQTDANGDAGFLGDESGAREAGEEDALAGTMAELDAVLARTEQVLAGGARSPEKVEKGHRDPLIHEPDWDEQARLSDWRRAVDETQDLPPVLAAALALDAWQEIQPLHHKTWLGPLLAAALLRERKKTRAHLACLNVGLRQIAPEQRRARNGATRLLARIDAIAAAAEAGLKDHDRWVLARKSLELKLVGRRGHSRMGALIDLVMARPMVSAGMIARTIGVTPRAAQNMVEDLGLRELTGRTRYRAWGVV